MTEPFVRPDVRAFLEALKARPRPKLTAENIAAMRLMAPQGMALLEPPIGELAATRDLVAPGPGGTIPLRLFDARDAREPGPAVVFFHGGGFVIGNIDTHASMCAEIARRLDLPVISVDYRLAPEHPWPAAPDDAEAAARWVAASGTTIGRAITSLVLCGDSAGATLALVTALALRDRPAAVPVALQFALYPGADRGRRYPSDDAFDDGYGLDRADMDFYEQSYAPDYEDWRATPLAADQSGMPATLVVTAALDPLRDQGRAYAAKTIAAGVPTTYREVPGVIHGFLGFRRAIPSAARDLVSALDVARAMIEERPAEHDR
jgi:acetyl esterase/lipase